MTTEEVKLAKAQSVEKMEEMKRTLEKHQRAVERREREKLSLRLYAAAFRPVLTNY